METSDILKIKTPDLSFFPFDFWNEKQRLVNFSSRSHLLLDQVPGFTEDEKLWHFHPIAFVQHLKRLFAGATEISDDGLNLIKEFEGFAEYSYWDTEEKNLQSIGYGHQLTPSEREIYGDQRRKLTKEEGTEFLRKDVEKFSKAINENVKVTLNQNQFDALVSFVYNIGIGNSTRGFKSSTTLRELNNKNYNEAADAMLLWNKVDGVENRTLKRRRKKERELFLK
ncbi:lysozyme [bacterium]|nr:lysozyme [bacterium]